MRQVQILMEEGDPGLVLCRNSASALYPLGLLQTAGSVVWLLHG